MLAVVKAVLSYGSAGTRFLAGATILLGMFALPAQGQQTCGPSLAQCDLQQDLACLQRNYACGRYDAIVQTLFAEKERLTPDQKYFVGASFYGLYIRERAKGLECEMVTYGRDNLSDYLNTFKDSTSFGMVGQMDQIYHGTRMLNALNAVSGCVESAFTSARIQSIAGSEADDFAKSIFLKPSDPVKKIFEDLRATLSSFVSSASELETGIALRRVEIQSARNHLGAVKTIFESVFGAVTITGNRVTVDMATLDSLVAGSAAKLRTVEGREAEFRAAIGGVSAEEFDQIRSQNVADAQKYLNESAFHINMIRKVMPDDKTLPFWQLVDAVNAENDGKAAADSLIAVRRGWAEHGAATGVCAQPGANQQIWYCR